MRSPRHSRSRGNSCTPTNSVIPVSFRGHRGLWWDRRSVPLTTAPNPGGGHLCASDKGRAVLEPRSLWEALKSRCPPPLQAGSYPPTPQSLGGGLAMLSLKATALIRIWPGQAVLTLLGSFLLLRLLEACRGAMVGTKRGQAPRGTS